MGRFRRLFLIQIFHTRLLFSGERSCIPLISFFFFFFFFWSLSLHPKSHGRDAHCSSPSLFSIRARVSLIECTITKRRNADSVLRDGDGSLYFVKPLEREESFGDLIKYIQEQEHSTIQSPVKYGQTRE